MTMTSGGARANAGRKKLLPNSPCTACGCVERYKKGECKECAKKRNKLYVERLKATDIQKYRDKNKERNKRNYANKKESNFAKQIQKLYGLTVEQWNLMFESQEGKCMICQKHQESFKYRLAVDHCHKTGKVRALLCPKCNNAVAAYENHREQVEHYLEIFK